MCTNVRPDLWSDLQTPQQACFLIFDSSFALPVAFLLRSLRFVPNPEPDFRKKVKEIAVIRIEDVVLQLMIGEKPVIIRIQLDHPHKVALSVLKSQCSFPDRKSTFGVR